MAGRHEALRPVRQRPPLPRVVHDRRRVPSCGLRFEREEGYWAGALAINIGVTGAVFVVVFVTGLALTAPDVPVAPLLAILVPLMIIVPIAYYPFSKTLWMAVDRALLQHLDPDERLDEQM